MAKELDKLKLGKGNAFRQERIEAITPGRRSLGGRLSGVTQVDFLECHALPRHGPHPATDGFRRAEAEIERSPDVNDLAKLLAHAMKRPVVNWTS